MAKRAKEEKKSPDEKVSYWLDQVGEARKREQTFRKDGEKIQRIYDGSEQKTTPFNILFSNTETLLPAIYSATPRPVVERRFKDDDPLGKASSLAGTRMLEFLLDTNLHDYDPFDTVMRHTVLDALLPGRGVSRVAYDAEVTGLEAETPEEPAAKGETPTAPPSATPMPTVNYEMVCLETKHWNRVYYGYAKKWSKVPWVAFEEYIDKPEAVRLFGATKADSITFTTQDQPDDERQQSKEEQHQGDVKTACVYQIWDRQGGKMLRYVSAQAPDGLLKEEEDPLELSGFFPCPEPLQFIDKTHSLIPTALYKEYENQATELNSIQLRINGLVRACKARGIYDGSLGIEIQKLMEADENELVPAESASSLAAEKGLQNAIWFMPLEVIQSTLKGLYTARESCKQVIYEITGISDILRGASQASETATAQNIKNQWGTLRLKRYQKIVATYARDLLRLMLELAASKLSEDSWAKMTGLPFNTAQQAQQLQQLATIAQQTGQPLDPQTQARLQAPIWEDVLNLLRDDLQRSYRIDIETNSTVEPSATEDRQQMTDLLTALAQYVQGVAPLVAEGVMPFEIVQSMMLLITRQFPAGSKVEDYIKQMQPPAPKQDDGKAQQAQMQAQQQAAQQSMQLEQQKGQMDLQMKTMQAEKDLLAQKIDLEMREMQLKADSDKFTLQQQVAQEKLAMQSKVHEVKTTATDQVRSIKDASQKKEQQSAQKSDQTLQQIAQQMAQIQTELQSAIAEQGTQTGQAMEKVVEAIKAPRIKKAIRGKDGRIEAMEEQVA